MDKKSKIIIWLSSTFAVLIIFFSIAVSISNGQIKRQQEVQTAKANISKEERRVDLFKNIVENLNQMDIQVPWLSPIIDSLAKVLNVAKAQDDYNPADFHKITGDYKGNKEEK